ncbi:MAG: DUF885 family protein, partial [Bdellovibrionales bacterium]|nr:DUF885 family protein [Massilia sp.]
MTMSTSYQRRLAVICIALAIGAMAMPAQGAHAPAHARAGHQQSAAAFDTWSDAFAADWVRLSPERATSAQYFSGPEQQALDRQLAPVTQAQRAKTQSMARAGLARLDKFLAGPLGDTQRISAETMRWSLRQVVAGEPFEDHAFVFSQFGGTQVSLVTFMTETHPIRRAADVDSYLARLEQIGT